MIYSKIQLERLQLAEPHFENAKRDRVRNAPRWLTQEIIDIYESATGKKILHKDISCAVCVLRVYQIVGKTYYSDLEELKTQNEIENNVEKNIETDAESSRHNSKKDEKSNNRNKRKKKKSS